MSSILTMTFNCPSGAAPSNLPIPTNINYVVVPGQTGNYPGMVQCCQPNAVKIIDNCWVWCEIPSTMVAKGKTIDGINSAFSQCLGQNSLGSTQHYEFRTHYGGALSAAAGPNRAVVVWAAAAALASLALAVLV